MGKDNSDAQVYFGGVFIFLVLLAIAILQLWIW